MRSFVAHAIAIISIVTSSFFLAADELFTPIDLAIFSSSEQLEDFDPFAQREQLTAIDRFASFDQLTSYESYASYDQFASNESPDLLAGCVSQDFPTAALREPHASRRFYLSGIIGASFATLTSGGDQSFSDGSSYPNTGSINRALLQGGGAVGVAFDRPFGALRFELEGRGRETLNGQTLNLNPDGSIFGPYKTQTTDGWSVMANLWRERALTNSLGVYAGGGIGAGGYQLSTINQDTAASFPPISGSSSIANFAWQAGGGVTYAITEHATLDLGYRFFAIGTGQTPLTGDPTITSAAYSSAFSASELLLSIRIYEPFRRLCR